MPLGDTNEELRRQSDLTRVVTQIEYLTDEVRGMRAQIALVVTLQADVIQIRRDLDRLLTQRNDSGVNLTTTQLTTLIVLGALAFVVVTILIYFGGQIGG